MKGLEWLLESPEDVVVYGLMVREFGEGADEATYGPMARRVHAGDQGPEYEWTALRRQEFERLDLRTED